MADVLTFLERADGTLVAQTAVSTLDGQTITVSGTTVTTVPAVETSALSIVQVNSDGSATQVLFGSAYPGGTIQGPAKLAQRFLDHLMTPSGSIPYRPNQGCLFMTRLQQHINSEADIVSAFIASLPAILANMQGEETVSDALDQRFAGAQLTNIFLSGTAVTLAIKVLSLAGEAAGITLPLSFSF